MGNQLFMPNQTFGDLLRYFRRRERLTQLELSIMVGYSEAQIGRLENNQRRPDLMALKALFIPALHLDKEPELAEYFLELAQTTREQDAPVPGISPYKGLLFFEESDCELFFGREALTEHLVKHVMDLAANTSNHFLAVVGASGSGKSSLVRAGLAATLKRAGWSICVFTPTATPLKVMDFHLNSMETQSASRVLVLVDQFEEVFTLCRDEIERIKFIEKLLSLAQDQSRKFSVVITLRADFYSHCAQYPFLRQAVAAEQEYIGQMSREELKRAIEEPAKRGGWEFEPGLVDLLLNDVGARGASEPEPGALPLLSHALLATWEHRRGHIFTIDGYRATGSVRGAIAQTAENIFADKLDQTQQEIARDVFLRLTELGEGTEDTRRRAALNELVRQAAEATQLRMVLDTLAEARLITLNEESAEVAHEALIREWQRLHEWLTQDRDGLLLHRHLTESAHEWEAMNREESELYRGARLAQAREWASANATRLNESERAFLTASVEHEQKLALEREAQRQRELEAAQKLAQTEKARAEEHSQSANRLRIRNRLISTVGIVALMLAVLAGVFSLQSNQNAALAQQNLITAQTAQSVAEANYEHAESLRLASEANLILAKNGDAETAALLSIHVLEKGYSPEADAALIRSLSNINYRKVFKGHTGPIYAVTFSPDNKYILTGGLDGTARLWNIQTGQEIQQYVGHTSRILTVAFSPDGKHVLTGSDDKTARLWDIKTGQQLSKISDSNSFTFAAYSPNGKYILTIAGHKMRLWDALTDQTIHDFIVNTATASFSPDGKYILANDSNNDTSLWDVTTGEEVGPLQGQGRGDEAIFSPNGKNVFVAQESYSKLLLINIETGQTIQAFNGSGNSMAFSPNGKYVLFTDQAKTVSLWDIQTGQEIRRYFGHEAAIRSAAFSLDGQYILTGSEDGTARLWTTPLAKPLFTFMGHTQGITSVSYSPNGEYILTSSKDNTARLWDAETRQELRSFVGHTKSVTSIAISSDGKYAVTSSKDKTARLWDIQTGQELQTFSGFLSGIASVAFSPDGRYVLTTGIAKVSDFRGQTILWNVKTGEKIRTLEEGPGRSPSHGTMLAFSPDGKKIVIAGYDFGVHIFDTVTGQELTVLKGHTSSVNSVVFSLDSKYILTGSNDKTARLWAASTGKELREFTDSNSAILSAAFSPDGKYIVTGHSDTTARLWDFATGKVVRVLTGHSDVVTSVAFSPDGKHILTGSEDGTARIWDTDYHDTIRFACSLLWRDLTDIERTQYSITDTKPTCPQP